MASFPGAIVLNVGMRTIFNNLSVCKGFLAPSLQSLSKDGEGVGGEVYPDNFI